MTERMIVALGLLVLGACNREQGAGRGPAQPADSTGHSVTAIPGDSSVPSIVFVGTSLTAGLGLDPDSAYPAILQRKLDSAGFHYEVVNAGVSGESSAGALARIDWVLRGKPAILVLETGANDGLRGQDPDSLRANIQQALDRVRSRSPETRVILAGMEALPNLGAEYTRRFHAVYPALAQANGLPLIPFLLARVAGVDSLNQPDGIHPNERGERMVADNVWQVLSKEVSR